MIKTLLSFVFTLFIGLINAQQLEWNTVIGSTSTEVCESTVVDAVGNIYSTGYFEGTVDFNTGAAVNDLTSSGVRDAYILKLNNAGEFEWVKSINSSSDVLGYTITVGGPSNDKVYIGGTFEGMAEFNPDNPGTNLITSVGLTDGFILKLNDNGAFEWVKQFGSVGNEGIYSLKLDPSEQLYSTGAFENTVNFDPGNSPVDLVAHIGGTDVFVMKHDISDNLLWAKRFGGASYNDKGTSITYDSDDNIIVAGEFEGTGNFDPVANFDMISNGGIDVFISKLAHDGDWLWAKNIGGLSNELNPKVEAKGINDIYITGSYQGTSDFDPSPTINNITSAGAHDIYIANFNQIGTLLEVESFGGTGEDYGRGIDLSSTNEVYITGDYESTVNFNNAGGTYELTSAGQNDAFVLKLNSNLSIGWAKSIGGINQQKGKSIFVDDNNDVYVSGHIEGVTDFNPFSGVTNIPTSNGSVDAFIMKLAPCAPQSSVDSQSNCASYTWTNGIEYTVDNNTATQVLETINGCDSIITLNLEIYPLPIVSGGVDLSVCTGDNIVLNGSGADTYTWSGIDDGLTPINGNGFMKIIPGSYSYEVTGTGSNSCENVDTIIVLVYSTPTFTITPTHVTCNGLTDGTLMINGLNPTTAYQVEYTGTIVNYVNAGTITTNASGDITITGLAPQNFTNIVITAQSGCQFTDLTTYTINQPSPLVITQLPNITECESIGQLTITGNASGGVGGYSYFFDNTITNATAFTPPIGTTTYTMTVIDANSCTQTDIYQIINIEPTPTFTISSTNPTTCNGTDGSITLIGLTANSPYIISITNVTATSLTSNASGNLIVTPLTENTYSNFNLTSMGGCIGQDLTTIITLSDPTPPSVYAGVDQNICIGNQVILTAVSASGSLITWDNGVIDGVAFTPTATSTYAAIVNDNGCVITDSIKVTLTSIDDASFSYSELSFCLNDINQSPTVIATGGAYTYTTLSGGPSLLINSTNGTIDLNTSDQGTYNITYTTNGTCPANHNETLTLNSVPEINLNITNTNCGNNTGSVDATITSIAPYSTLWSTGQTSNNITSLESNNYYITVTDNNLCYAMQVATVSNTEISLSGTTTNNLCYGNENGSIDLTVTGTTGPYLYYWSNGETTQDISDLTAGQYEVFVTDNSNCTSTLSFNITQPNSLDATFTTTNPTTCGGIDGTIMSTVIGGTPIYTFDWLDNTNTNIGTNQDLLGVSGGIYTLNILDDNGCTYSKTAILNNVGGPIVTLNQTTNATCLNDGAIDIDVNSTVAIQSYLWSNGELTEDITNLSPNNYTLTIVDINNCASYFSTLVSPSIPAPTNICIVTVDTATNTNLVVWEKIVTTDIAYYVIFRETSVANLFLPVDTIEYDQPSQFTDPIAYPQFRSWRYKIKSVNTCGYSSKFGDIHKTIHITINTDLAGTYNLNWDEYEGFPYTTFDIWRYTDTDGWGTNPIQSVPNNQLSLTDTPPTIDGLDYIIEITPPNVCTSTTNKAIDHNSSRSNKTKSIAVPTGGDNSNISTLKTELTIEIYPNPSTGKFNILLNDNSNKTLKLYDMKGSIVKVVESSSKSIEIDLNQYENGMYILEIATNNGVIRKQLLKQ
jgi:hypothetical protein